MHHLRNDTSLHGKSVGGQRKADFMDLDVISVKMDIAENKMQSIGKKEFQILYDQARMATHVRNGGNNLHVLPPVCAKTLKKYLEIVAPHHVVQAAPKILTRGEALMDIRNALTAACAMDIFKDVPNELMVSTDAVAVQLGSSMDEKPTVYSTGKQHFLKQRNLP